MMIIMMMMMMVVVVMIDDDDDDDDDKAHINTGKNLPYLSLPLINFYISTMQPQVQQLGR